VPSRELCASVISIRVACRNDIAHTDGALLLFLAILRPDWLDRLPPPPLPLSLNERCNDPLPNGDSLCSVYITSLPARLLYFMSPVFIYLVPVYWNPKVNFLFSLLFTIYIRADVRYNRESRQLFI
jgi:hypothetical protein